MSKTRLKLSEKEWVASIEPRLERSLQRYGLPGTSVAVRAGKKLAYTYEIHEYAKESVVTDYKTTPYQTDLLIFDDSRGGTLDPQSRRGGQVEEHQHARRADLQRQGRDSQARPPVSSLRYPPFCGGGGRTITLEEPATINHEFPEGRIIAGPFVVLLALVGVVHRVDCAQGEFG